jgi:uncharacterized protein (DUF1330 family)
MAKGYWVAHIDVRDPEAYKTYLAAIAAVFRKHHGRYLVRAGAFQSMEGANRSRHVVVEFPSYQAALDCYRSPECAKAIALRQAHADSNLIVLEGHDGPQPAD